MKKITMTIFPEDVQARAKTELTFDQAKEFLRLNESRIRDAMVTAANETIEDLMQETEVLL